MLARFGIAVDDEGQQKDAASSNNIGERLAASLPTVEEPSQYSMHGGNRWLGSVLHETAFASLDNIKFGANSSCTTSTLAMTTNGHILSLSMEASPTTAVTTSQAALAPFETGFFFDDQPCPHVLPHSATKSATFRRRDRRPLPPVHSFKEAFAKS